MEFNRRAGSTNNSPRVPFWTPDEQGRRVMEHAMTTLGLAYDPNNPSEEIAHDIPFDHNEGLSVSGRLPIQPTYGYGSSATPEPTSRLVFGPPLPPHMPQATPQPIPHSLIPGRELPIPATHGPIPVSHNFMSSGSHNHAEPGVPQNSPEHTPPTARLSLHSLGVPNLLLGGASSSRDIAEVINENRSSSQGVDSVDPRVTPAHLEQMGISSEVFGQWFDAAINTPDNGPTDDGNALNLNNLNEVAVHLVRTMIRSGDFGNPEEFRENLRPAARSNTNPRPRPRPSVAGNVDAIPPRSRPAGQTLYRRPSPHGHVHSLEPQVEHNSQPSSANGEADTVTDANTNTVTTDYDDLPSLMEALDSSDDGHESITSPLLPSLEIDADAEPRGRQNQSRLYNREPWHIPFPETTRLRAQGGALPPMNGQPTREGQAVVDAQDMTAAFTLADMLREPRRTTWDGAAISSKAKKIIDALEVLDVGLLERFCKLGDNGCSICLGSLQAGSLLAQETTTMATAAVMAENIRADSGGTENCNRTAIDAVALPCAHVFHSQCLLPWFTTHIRATTCPTCRFNLDPRRLLSNDPSLARSGGVQPTLPPVSLQEEPSVDIIEMGNAVLGGTTASLLRFPSNIRPDSPQSDRRLQQSVTSHERSSNRVETDETPNHPLGGSQGASSGLTDPDSAEISISNSPSAIRDFVSSAAVEEGSIEAPSTASDAFRAFRDANGTLRAQDDQISSQLEASNAEQELLSIELDFLSAQIEVAEGVDEALRRELTTIMDNVRGRIQIIRTGIGVLGVSRTLLRQYLETPTQGMASTVLGSNGDQTEWSLPLGNSKGGIKAWIEIREAQASGEEPI